MLAFVIAVIVHAHCTVPSVSHAQLIVPSRKSDYLQINLAQGDLRLGTMGISPVAVGCIHYDTIRVNA